MTRDIYREKNEMREKRSFETCPIEFLSGTHTYLLDTQSSSSKICIFHDETTQKKHVSGPKSKIAIAVLTRETNYSDHLKTTATFVREGQEIVGWGGGANKF